MDKRAPTGGQSSSREVVVRIPRGCCAIPIPAEAAMRFAAALLFICGHFVQLVAAITLQDCEVLGDP
jgi:hypothetical protein